MKLYIVLAFSCLCMLTQAQKEIEVDSITNVAKDPLPFDSPAIIKIRRDSKPAASFAFYYKSMKGYENILHDPNALQMGINIPERNIGYSKVGGKGYLSVTIGSSDNLNGNIPPNSKMLLLLFDNYEKGYDIMRSAYERDSAAVDQSLSELRFLNERALGDTLVLFTPQNHSDTGLINLENQLHPYFVELDSIEDSIGSLDNIVINSYRFPCLCDFVCVDPCLKTWSNDSGMLTKLSLLPTLLNQANMDFTRMGQKNFGSIYTPLKLVTDHNKMVANLEKSVTEIDEFAQIIRMIELCEQDICLDSMLFQLNSLKSFFLVKISSIRNYDAKKKEIINLINNSLLLMTLTKVEGSTTVLNMKSRTAFRVTPDFGLIYYGFQRDFWGLSPYAGLQINFRASKTDMPFRVYRGYPIAKLSMSLGYSINQMKADSKRSDFFTKGSLLTGVGYKMSHALRLTGGALWFYAEDPNPIITRKELNCVPYLGLSVDLSIAELLNGFKDLITTSPF